PPAAVAFERDPRNGTLARPRPRWHGFRERRAPAGSGGPLSRSVGAKMGEGRPKATRLGGGRGSRKGVAAEACCASWAVDFIRVLRRSQRGGAGRIGGGVAEGIRPDLGYEFFVLRRWEVLHRRRCARVGLDRDGFTDGAAR